MRIWNIKHVLVAVASLADMGTSWCLQVFFLLSDTLRYCNSDSPMMLVVLTFSQSQESRGSSRIRVWPSLVLWRSQSDLKIKIRMLWKILINNISVLITALRIAPLSFTKGQFWLWMLFAASRMNANGNLGWCDAARSCQQGSWASLQPGLELRLKLAAIYHRVTWRIVQLKLVWPLKDADGSWPPRPQLTW